MNYPHGAPPGSHVQPPSEIHILTHPLRPQATTGHDQSRKETLVSPAHEQVGVKFRRQVPYGSYILDFYCVKARLVVEVDGSQHYTPEGRRRDAKRDAYLRNDGLEVLRFLNDEVLSNEVGVEQVIYERVQRSLENRPV